MYLVILFLAFLAAAAFLGVRVYSQWTLTWSQSSQKVNAADLASTMHYVLPPLKERTSTKMAMGLKQLDHSTWLTIDSDFVPEHNIRLELLAKDRSNVVECLPPSMAACHEVLDLAVSFLLRRYPQHFSIIKSPKGPLIHNNITSESFPVGNHPDCQKPLETAALLAMEDLNVLIKDPNTGDYLLQASATLFPAGWRLQERIGTSLARLHAPVPGWSQKLGAHVNRYFDHLSPKTAMERTNLFIQTNPALFWDAPEVETQLNAADVKLEEITVRRERQTFTRLPKSNAILFTVRTYMKPLTSVSEQELKALKSQIAGWEPEIKVYKGYELWGNQVEEWCKRRLGDQEVSVSAVERRTCPI